jgi:anti-sigma regulatory factor (Ser/Thr protein kinase)
MPLVAVGRPRRARWVGPPVAVAVGRVRRDLPRVLARWRVREDVIDEVVMVVAELLDNVVRHARSQFRVLVELDQRRLYVAVEDELAGAAPLRTPETRDAPRRGLRLVNATALRWGWNEQDAGKTVWAEFLA